MPDSPPPPVRRQPLWARVAVTLVVLALWRAGCRIGLPGIDLDALRESVAAGSASPAWAGAYDKLSVFALGVAPYASAGILVQLVALAFLPVGTLQSRRAAEVRRLQRFARILTIGVSMVQALVLYKAILRDPKLHVFIESPALFPFTTVAAMSAGTCLLVWLADLVTLRGLGNGIALLYLAPMSMHAWAHLSMLWRTSTDPARGAIPLAAWTWLGLSALALVLAKARRSIPLARRVRENGAAGPPAELPAPSLAIPVCIGGAFPLLMSGAILGLVASVTHFETVAGRIIPLVVFTVLCACLFWRPGRIAAELTAGGLAPAKAPPEETERYLSGILVRWSLIGVAVIFAVWVVLDRLWPTIPQAGAARDFFFPFVSIWMAVAYLLDLSTVVRAAASGSGWVAVAVFPAPAEAQLARVRLHARGIRVHLINEYLVHWNFLWSCGLGGISACVQEKDVVQAEELLKPAAAAPGSPCSTGR